MMYRQYCNRIASAISWATLNTSLFRCFDEAFLNSKGYNIQWARFCCIFVNTISTISHWYVHALCFNLILYSFGCWDHIAHVPRVSSFPENHLCYWNAMTGANFSNDKFIFRDENVGIDGNEYFSYDVRVTTDELFLVRSVVLVWNSRHRSDSKTISVFHGDYIGGNINYRSKC